MLDLSTNKDFETLAAIASDIHASAEALKIDFMLIGATARDVMLQAFGLVGDRRTEDVDFGFLVATWAEFEALRLALLKHGRFSPHKEPSIHKLRHAGTGYQLDIVPFGAIEDNARMITLPPGSGMEFNCFGMREAFAARVPVILPGPITAYVASVPALAVLKLAAFSDRKERLPRRDAPDLLLLSRKYLDCNNLDRLLAEHADLMTDDFDYEIGSARLLARDIAKIVDDDALRHLIDILAVEVDPLGAQVLVNQTGAPDQDRARTILAGLYDEMVLQQSEK